MRGASLSDASGRALTSPGTLRGWSVAVDRTMGLGGQVYNPPVATPVNTRASDRMKVFISHAYADAELARRVAEVLEASGFQTWDESRILPGDNWGEKIGEALRESEAMVVLLTPNSLHYSHVSHEISYALGDTAYKDRLIPVIAAPPGQLPEGEIPWVLRLDRFHTIRLPDKDQDEESLKKIAHALQEPA